MSAPTSPLSDAAPLAEVAVARPVPGTFTYAIPPELAASLRPGGRVAVPFGKGDRRALGFYLGPSTTAPPAEVKRILEVLDLTPALLPELIHLLRWASDYYRFPLGEALRSALPPGLAELTTPKARRPAMLTWAEVVPLPAGVAERSGPVQRAVLSYLAASGRTELESLNAAVPGARDAVRSLAKRGRVKITEHAPERARPESHLANAVPERLSADQAAAIQTLSEATAQGGFHPFLLHGVTGSGKTEVYLRAIAEVRARGKTALCLVPEIGLTPQLMGRFRSRFGDEVALLHSGLKDTERLAEWRRLRDGQAPVAVGVRSAIFAPIANLGLIVVDEEHDSSFKQEEKLRYHARDLALVRGQQSGCTVVLGSATPSLETLYNARTGRYGLLTMPQRIDDRPMPKVEVIDLRQRSLAPDQSPTEVTQLSPPLQRALSEVLERGEQAILFLNRRGHSTFLTCAVCGLTVQCPNCSIALTHHLARRGLLCHYCGYQQAVPEHCPECRSALLRLGVGTEKVAEEVQRDFPGARLMRLDRDSAGDSTELTRSLSDFARGEYNVMIGTQMVAKGHDFPGVTLVGVILADTALALPDFRAAERTFQLLTQVAGRAGRGKQAGRVVVQTFNPESDAVSRVIGHDFLGFAERELQRREALGFPPYSRLLGVRIDAMHEAAARAAAQSLAHAAEAAIRAGSEPLRLLGPAPAPIARIRGRWRFQLMVKGRSHKAIAPVERRLEQVASQLPTEVRIAFDIDPVSMM